MPGCFQIMPSLETQRTIGIWCFTKCLQVALCLANVWGLANGNNLLAIIFFPFFEGYGRGQEKDVMHAVLIYLEVTEYLFKV